MEEEIEIYNKIENKIFTPAKQIKSKTFTYLNANCLNDTFWYIKKNALSLLEKSCIVDYRLQTLLIEIFQMKKKYSCFQDLVDFVLGFLRNEPYYWMKGSDTHEKIIRKNGMKLKDEEIIVDLVEEEEDNEKKIEDKKVNFQETGISHNKAIENYLKYLKETENTKKFFSDEESNFDSPLKKIHDFFHPKIDSNSSNPDIRKRSEQIDYISHSLVKIRKLNNSTLKRGIARSGATRFTRNMAKVQFNKGLKETKFMFETQKSELESKLNVDLSFCKKIDYNKSIFFNPSYYNYTKIDMNLISLLYRFMMKKHWNKYYRWKKNWRKMKGFGDFKGIEKIEKFSLMIQNFFMWLNFTNEPIEKHGGRNRIIQKKFRDDFWGWFQQENSFLKKNGKKNILKKFLEHAIFQEKYRIDSNLSKIESIRIKQLTFLENVLTLGNFYCKFYKGKKLEIFQAIRETGVKLKNQNEVKKLNTEEKIYNNIFSKNGVKKYDFKKKDKHYFLENLELFPNPNTQILIQSLKLFIKNFEKKSENKNMQENLRIYSKLISKKEKTLRKSTKKIKTREEKEYYKSIFMDEIHDNQFCYSKKNAKSVKNYLDYVNNPSTAKLQWYKFYKKEGFKWPEIRFKNFIKGYKKFHKTPINNAKIAQFMQECENDQVEISANQVKFLKQKFVRLAKKRAKENRVVLYEQLERDLKEYDFQVLFPWLNSKYVIEE